MLSVPQLRAFLRASPAIDEELEGLAASVIAQWEGETGGLWARREGHVQVIRPRAPSRVLFLELLPVASDGIEGVTERGADEAEATALEVADFVLSLSGRLERAGCDSWGHEVVVTYDGGYTAATCPPDVRLALLTQARFLQARTSDDKVAATFTSVVGGGQQSLERADFHPLFQAAAARYRRFA